jgi:outer membrane protein assembly factor BamB
MSLSGAFTPAAGCLAPTDGESRGPEPGTVECADGVSSTAGERTAGDETWPTPQYDARRRGHVPGRLGPQGCPSVQWTWRHDEDITGLGMHTSALVVGDTVYIADESPPSREGGDDDTTMIAIDAATGTERWRVAGAGKPVRTPTIADEMMFVPMDNGIQAIDIATQEAGWHTTFVTGQEYDGDSEWAEIPAVVDGTVYAGTHLGTLYAIDAATGGIEWEFEAKGLAAERIMDEEPPEVAEVRQAGRFDGPVAAADGIVDAANWDSRLYAVDATTGEEVWSTFQYSPIDWTSRPSPPAVHDGTVYTSTRQSGAVIALDAQTGEQEWVYDELGYSEGVPPAVTDTSVYASAGTSSERMFLVALDKATGRRRWQTWIALPSRGPIVDEQNVYIEQWGTLLACERRSGTEQWWFRMHADSWASPSLANSAIYTTDDRGHVYGVW